MGLLSRKKTTPSPSTPPLISAPLSNPILTSVPSDYAKGAHLGSAHASLGAEKSSQRGALGRVEGGGYGGALPSPPGSPINPPYPYKSPTPSYTSQPPPRPQQQQATPQSRTAVPLAAQPGHFLSHASTSRCPSEQQRHMRPQATGPDLREGVSTNPSSLSSEASNASNVLHNGNAANGSSIGTSVGTVESDREVEGKMEKMGLDGVQAKGRASCMSVDMADATPGTSSVGRAVESGRGATPISVAAASNYPQQVEHPQRPILPAANESSTSSASRTSSLGRKTASRYSLTDFTFIRTLGTGSFGRVHLVRSQHNSRSYAVKVLSKDRVVKMKQIEHTNSEREMLERVRHPFLVNLWGTFKDSKNLYMVMDFVAGGELFSLLRKSQRFPDPVAKFFAAEVALALDYLHSLDIIYRDLKPENILLGADGHVKITDFGFAKHVPDITWTLCGTPDYLAPEIVQSRGYNKSVDWYALGVLMFEMLAGYPPFFTEDSNPMRLYEKIIAGKVRYPAYFGPDAKDLLKSLLTPDLTKRFGNLANGSRDVFTHVWFHEVDWERLYRKEIPAPYVPKVEGDWDASNFDQYPEVDLSEYGSTGPDPHGHHFLSF